MAQLASVLAWGASGRVFKSHCSDKPSEKSDGFFIFSTSYLKFFDLILKKIYIFAL